MPELPPSLSWLQVRLLWNPRQQSVNETAQKTAGPAGIEPILPWATACAHIPAEIPVCRHGRQLCQDVTFCASNQAAEQCPKNALSEETGRWV